MSHLNACGSSSLQSLLHTAGFKFRWRKCHPLCGKTPRIPPPLSLVLRKTYFCSFLVSRSYFRWIISPSYMSSRAAFSSWNCFQIIPPFDYSLLFLAFKLTNFRFPIAIFDLMAIFNHRHHCPQGLTSLLIHLRFCDPASLPWKHP